MRIWRCVAITAVAVLASATVHAQSGISNLPRKEVLIVENPEGTVKNPGWFNPAFPRWTIELARAESI